MKNNLNIILAIGVAALALVILIKPSVPPVPDDEPIQFNQDGGAQPPTGTSDGEINGEQDSNINNQIEETQPMPSPTNSTNSKQYKQAEQVLEKGKSYSVTLSTSEGDITIALDAENTPITSNNFAFLASDGFYDNVIFHRALEGFMIQGGDPTGTGSGGPGYKFADEYLEGEYKRGTLAMANSGPNTNGSQFFIMHADYGLPNLYVIFGKVTEGLEVVDKIATAKVKSNAMGEPSSPVNPVMIKSASLNEL